MQGLFLLSQVTDKAFMGFDVFSHPLESLTTNDGITLDKLIDAGCLLLQWVFMHADLFWLPG